MEKLINEFSFGLFFWQSLIFIFLVLILKKFAWKPILDAVNERESSIKDAMNAADEAKKEMASIQEGNQKILKECFFKLLFPYISLQSSRGAYFFLHDTKS